jgi:phage shock protein PspC (stress-responsive transcriptional regulator)
MEDNPDSWSDEGMSETTTPEVGEAPEAPQPTEPPGTGEHTYERRLERIEDGRWIAGVATGLADWFNVPVWLVRVIFLLLLGPAGIGLVVYLALIVFMPHESEEDSPAERWFGEMDSPAKWGGALIAVIGGLILLGALTNVDGGILIALALVAVGVLLFQTTGAGRASPPETQVEDGAGTPPRVPRPPKEPKAPRPPRERKPRERSNLGAFTIAGVLIALGLLGSADIAGWLYPEAVHYFAVAVLGIGLGLFVGTWFGRSRGLILLGVALLPPLFATFAVANADQIFSGWGIDEPPVTGTIVVDEVIGTRRIDIGVGDPVIDARDAVWGPNARLNIDIGAGEVRVLLPDDVDIRAELGIGEMSHDGRSVASGLGDLEYRSGDGDGPLVTIDMGIGDLSIEGGEK